MVLHIKWGSRVLLFFSPQRVHSPLPTAFHNCFWVLFLQELERNIRSMTWLLWALPRQWCEGVCGGPGRWAPPPNWRPKHCSITILSIRVSLSLSFCFSEYLPCWSAEMETHMKLNLILQEMWFRSLSFLICRDTRPLNYYPWARGTNNKGTPFDKVNIHTEKKTWKIGSEISHHSCIVLSFWKMRYI